MCSEVDSGANMKKITLIVTYVQSCLKFDKYRRLGREKIDKYHIYVYMYV